MAKQLGYDGSDKPSVTEQEEDNAQQARWQLLRRAIVLNLLVIVLGASGLGAGYWYHQSLLKQQVEMDTNLKTLETNLRTLGDTKRLIDSDDYKTFLRLKSLGFFNVKTTSSDGAVWRIVMEEQLLRLQEKTAAWLKQEKQLLAIRDTSFTYSPPELLQVPVSKEHVGRLTVYGSRLNLQAQLMHEGYMLDLLNYIRTLPINGLLTLQSCDLNRLQTPIKPVQTEQAYLKLNCVFQWYIARLEAGA